MDSNMDSKLKELKNIHDKFFVEYTEVIAKYFDKNDFTKDEIFMILAEQINFSSTVLISSLASSVVPLGLTKKQDEAVRAVIKKGNENLEKVIAYNVAELSKELVKAILDSTEEE